MLRDGRGTTAVTLAMASVSSGRMRLSVAAAGGAASAGHAPRAPPPSGDSELSARHSHKGNISKEEKMIRPYLIAASIALSVASIPTIGRAAEIGVPQQLQQIQQQLQAIQAALTGQGTSTTQQLQAVQTSLAGQTQQLQSLQTAVGGVAKVRKFYLTQDNTFDALEAPNACAAGYHMASLWEIFDPSSLVYDTALGHLSGDGSGPPEFHIGWIRTGGGSGVGQ